MSTGVTLRIPTAPVYEPLLGTGLRYKGARGGRASGKSHVFGDNVLDYTCSFPGMRIVCLREVQKTLKLSSKLMLEDKIKHYKLGRLFEATRDQINTPGGGMVVFQGLQDHTSESIKSLEGFDVFWTDEAQKLSERSLTMLRPTARSTQRTVLPMPELWFSWNPTNSDDPVETLFADGPPNSCLVKSSFRDNPWLPPELLPEIEWDRKRDPDKYHHVWEGGFLARSDVRVFNNWSVEEFDVPTDVSLYWGADWGFSVDPSVLVGSFIVGSTLFVAFEAWEVGCEIENLPDLFDKADPEFPRRARAWGITADSARADTISYMKRHGYPRIAPARKGPGSIEDGVEFLKTYDIKVHPRCRHVVDELTFYSYKTDPRTDEVIPILADKNNHTIDALRYSLESVRWTVKGAAEARTGMVARTYDAGLAPVERVAVADFGQESGVIAFEGQEYDGGLT